MVLLVGQGPEVIDLHPHAGEVCAGRLGPCDDDASLRGEEPLVQEGHGEHVVPCEGGGVDDVYPAAVGPQLRRAHPRVEQQHVDGLAPLGQLLRRLQGAPRLCGVDDQGLEDIPPAPIPQRQAGLLGLLVAAARQDDPPEPLVTELSSGLEAEAGVCAGDQRASIDVVLRHDDLLVCYEDPEDGRDRSQWERGQVVRQAAKRNQLRPEANQPENLPGLRLR